MAELMKSTGSNEALKEVKRDMCEVCQKVVYANDKLSADDIIFHKSCFRCGHCKKTLSLGNYAAVNGVHYCKPHFKQLFALKGNYTDGFKASSIDGISDTKSTSFNPSYSATSTASPNLTSRKAAFSKDTADNFTADTAVPKEEGREVAKPHAEDFAQKLAVKEAAVAKLAGEVEGLAQRLAAKEAAESKSAAEIEGLAQKLAVKETAVATSAAEIEELTKRLAVQDAAVAASTLEIEDLVQKVAVQDTVAAISTAEIEGLHAHIASVKATLSIVEGQTEEIAQLKSMLGDANATIHDLTTQLAATKEGST